MTGYAAYLHEFRAVNADRRPGEPFRTSPTLQALKARLSLQFQADYAAARLLRQPEVESR